MKASIGQVSIGLVVVLCFVVAAGAAWTVASD